MVYKHFRTVCIIRVAVVCATAYLFFFLLFQTSYYATLLIVGSVGLYQVFALIHFVERTNRDLTRFLQAKCGQSAQAHRKPGRAFTASR